MNSCHDMSSSETGPCYGGIDGFIFDSAPSLIWTGCLGPLNMLSFGAIPEFQPSTKGKRQVWQRHWFQHAVHTEEPLFE
eukprot:gene14650-biopygen4016